MHHCFWKNVAVNCNIFKIISTNLSWLTQNYGLLLVIRNLGQTNFKKKKHQYMLTLHGHAWADTACLYTRNKLTGVCTMMRAYVCVHSRKHNEVCMTFAQCPKNTGWGDTFQYKSWWNKHEGLPQGRLRQQHLFYRNPHKHEYSYRHTKTHENPLMKYQLLLLTMLPTNISNSIVTDFSNCEYHAPGPFQFNWIRVRSRIMKNTLFKCFFNKNVSLVCQENPKLTLLSLFCLLHNSENCLNSRFAPPPESWPYRWLSRTLCTATYFLV